MNLPMSQSLATIHRATQHFPIGDEFGDELGDELGDEISGTKKYPHAQN